MRVKGKKRTHPFFRHISFVAIISRATVSSEPYTPLLDPGVLNCDESRSLRGVDMLLVSNAGSGDISLPAELQGEQNGNERETQPLNAMRSMFRERLEKTACINPATGE